MTGCGDSLAVSVQLSQCLMELQVPVTDQCPIHSIDICSLFFITYFYIINMSDSVYNIY